MESDIGFAKWVEQYIELVGNMVNMPKTDIVETYENLTDKIPIRKLIEDMAYKHTRVVLRENDSRIQQVFGRYAKDIPAHDIAKWVSENFPYGEILGETRAFLRQPKTIDLTCKLTLIGIINSLGS